MDEHPHSKINVVLPCLGYVSFKNWMYRTFPAEHEELPWFYHQQGQGGFETSTLFMSLELGSFELQHGSCKVYLLTLKGFNIKTDSDLWCKTIVVP